MLLEVVLPLLAKAGRASARLLLIGVNPSPHRMVMGAVIPPSIPMVIDKG